MGKFAFHLLFVFVGVVLFQSVYAEDVGDLIRRNEGRGRIERDGRWIVQHFEWPKVEDRAVIAYWPQEKIDKTQMRRQGRRASLNDSSGPRAEDLCSAMGFQKAAGYEIWEPAQSETVAAVHPDGYVEFYWMRAEWYPYYGSELFGFGVFSQISCKKRAYD